MPLSKKRKTSPKIVAKDGDPHAMVQGIIGGGKLVRRAEMTHFLELRLQSFVAEELQPTIAGIAAELVEEAVKAVLPDLVAKAVAAHYGQEQAPEAFKPGAILGVDGEVLSSDTPRPALVLPGED